MVRADLVAGAKWASEPAWYLLSFKVEEAKLEFEKPRWTTDWSLLVMARSTSLGTLFTGERGIELTVDTKRSSEIRIRQNYGSSLNATCVTPF